MSSKDYQNSNLSSELHRYDLVVATTAKSINTTMKYFLKKMGKDPNAKPVELWYCKKSRTSPIELMNPITLSGGRDIFSLTVDDEVPSELKEAKFKFAVRAQFGIPEGVSGRNVDDILRLSQNRQQVHFNLFFKSFEIIEQKFDEEGPYMNAVSQPKGDPIVFETEVDMNFDEMDPESSFYKDLDEATKERLKNMNTSNMFSVQQLYLDLSTAALQNKPKISGLDTDSDALATVANKDFINTCWNAFSNSSAVVLGYAVIAIETEDRTSIQPTDLTFNVSPYYNDDGSKSNETDLYTLNYLMSSEGRPLKLGAPFDWNWVKDDKEAKTISGAMAVRREIFANFLSKTLSTQDPNTKEYPLSSICIDPKVSIGGTIVTWSTTSDFKPDPLPMQHGSINYIDEKKPEILKFSYTRSVETDKKIGEVFDVDNSWLTKLLDGEIDIDTIFDGFVNVTKGFINNFTDPLFADKHFALTSRCELTVEAENDLIKMAIKGDMYLDAFDPGDAFDTGNVAGYLGGYTKDIKLKITTDGSGHLTVKQQNTPDLIPKDAKLDKNIAAGLDGSTSMINNLRTQYLQIATTWADDFAKHIEDNLNNSGNMWVFPGGKTFTFEDAKFSKYQDLITHISYAMPS
jgi:hypothetical protein